jgi:hypothetical protein
LYGQAMHSLAIAEIMALMRTRSSSFMREIIAFQLYHLQRKTPPHIYLCEEGEGRIMNEDHTIAALPIFCKK